jgi:Tfp pilus assembly protein PilV
MEKSCILGLSLAEIMVSICLLSVIVLSIVTIFPYSIEALKTSKNMSVAYNIANKHLELYKSSFYMVPDVETMGNVELTADNHSSIDYAINMENTNFTPVVMVKKVQIENTKFADPNQIVEVIVTVKWKQSNGIKKVKTRSYVYNKIYLPINVPVY